MIFLPKRSKETLHNELWEKQIPRHGVSHSAEEESRACPATEWHHSRVGMAREVPLSIWKKSMEIQEAEQQEDEITLLIAPEQRSVLSNSRNMLHPENN